MNEFEIVTVIERPVADVFAAIQDLDRAAQWNPGVTEVRQTSPGPLGVGSTVVYVGGFLGRSYESSVEYTECVADKRIATKTTSGPFDLEVEIELDAADTGTKVTATYRGESRGFFKLAEPIVVRLTKRHFETANENLKTLLEADAL
jgi:carbon monoxide dehydrogenase subunit G